MRKRPLPSLREAAWCTAMILASTAASAQPVDPQSLGEAQAIFDSAERLMTARQYGEACPKFAEVVRLVPSGVGAKMRLAKCYDDAGRLASAWAAYLVAENAASTAGQADRARTAGERAAALRPRLSTLTILVPEGLRGVAGLEIKRNDGVVRQAEWGVAVPLDGGTYAITVTAPSRTPWKGEAQVKSEGSASTLTLPDQLQSAPAAPPPDATPAGAGGAPAWAWGVGGVGVALVGVSIGFLIDERGAQSSIDTACPGGKSCAHGFDAHGANTRLYRDFDVFVAAGAGGVVALGASIAGIATAPKRVRAGALPLPYPWAAPGAGGLGWGGRFQ